MVDALSIIALIVSLLAILLIVPLALLLSVKNTYSYAPIFILITRDTSNKEEVFVNGDTTILIQEFSGTLILSQGNKGRGTRVTITNAQEEGVLLKSNINIEIPQEYITEEGDILLPALRTMNFVMQTGDRAFFLGSYAL